MDLRSSNVCCSGVSCITDILVSTGCTWQSIVWNKVRKELAGFQAGVHGRFEVLQYWKSWLILDSKQQKIKSRKPLSNKKELNLSLAAQGMTSVPTVKNHSTDYISLAITPLLKPLQGLFNFVEYLFLFAYFGHAIWDLSSPTMPPALGMKSLNH